MHLLGMRIIIISSGLILFYTADDGIVLTVQYNTTTT